MSGVNGSLHGYNLYAYCFNNPVSYTDSEGNWPTNEEFQQLAGGVWDRIVDGAESVVEAVTNFVNDIAEDFENFDINNTSEQKVLESNYFSSYKGAIVLRPQGEVGFSFGIIVLGHTNAKIEDVQHEYGHYLQLAEMGFWTYTTEVAAPSVTAYFLDVKGKLPYDYYSSPWEHQADVYGMVDMSTASGRHFTDPWTESDGGFWKLIKLF